MSLFRRHPGFQEIGRLADEGLDDVERARLHDHLRDCDRCRREFSFILDIKRVAREISHPSPPRELLGEILERRESGDRVILPATVPPVRSLAPRVATTVLAVACLVAAVALFLLSAGEAAAGASLLRLDSATPEAGEEVAVEYRAASRLAAADELRLRIRWRAAEDPHQAEWRSPSSYGETRLRRVADRRFGASLRLPPGAVYAVFAVEDLDGATVDVNGGRFWEVVAHDADGRPVFEGLRQQVMARERRDRDLALEAARRMTELYPERAESWFWHLASRVRQAGPDDRAAVLDEFRPRFVRLERSLGARATVEAAELAAMVQLAALLGEPEAVERWDRRLQREAPTHPVALLRRLADLRSRSHSRVPGDLLRALEDEWDRAGVVEWTLLDMGLAAAVDAGDAEAALRWADRFERYFPEAALGVARQLAKLPSLRSEAADRIRRLLAELDASGRELRPLDHGVAREAERLARERRRLLAALGETLLAAGAVEEAVGTLAEAEAGGWDPALFRRLARARLSLGDTAGALRLHARVAVDPLTPAAYDDSVAASTGLDLSTDAWRLRLSLARDELLGRLEAESEDWPLRRDLDVLDREGETRNLTEILEGQVALIVIWSRFSWPSRADLPRIVDHAGLLDAAGVRVVTITGEAPTPALDAALAEAGYRAPVFHDPHGDVAEATGVRGVPFYVVVDATGRLRLAETRLEPALRLALTLSAERRKTA